MLVTPVIHGVYIRQRVALIKVADASMRQWSRMNAHRYWQQNAPVPHAAAAHAFKPVRCVRGAKCHKISE